MIFILIFLVILGITFGIIALMLRPSAEESATGRRVHAAVAQHASPHLSRPELEDRLKRNQKEAFVWMEHFFTGSKFLRRLNLLLLQSQSSLSAGTILISAAGLGIVTLLLVYALTAFWPAAVVVAAGVSYAPFMALQILRNRRLNRFNEQLPDCIAICTRALRAGHSIVAAIDIVSSQTAEPARTEFAEVFKKQNYGLPLREALLQMLERVPSMDLRVFVTGILVQKDTGGNLAEVLDRIVMLTRDRKRIRGEIRIHTAQGRLTGWILCLLPPALLLLINLMNPGYSSVLLHDPRGQKVLYAGIGLLLAGAVTIRHIVRGIEV